MDIKSLDQLPQVAKPTAIKVETVKAKVPVVRVPRVENSDIKRTPVNKQAALVTSPAPWWARREEEPVIPKKVHESRLALPCLGCKHVGIRCVVKDGVVELNCQVCKMTMSMPGDEKTAETLLMRPLVNLKTEINDTMKQLRAMLAELSLPISGDIVVMLATLGDEIRDGRKLLARLTKMLKLPSVGTTDIEEGVRQLIAKQKQLIEELAVAVGLAKKVL